MTEFLNHYSGWLALLAIILSIPMGIGINLISPKVQSWLAFQSRKRRSNRIQLLQTRVKDIETLLSEPTLLMARLVKLSFQGLAGLIILVLVFIALTAVDVSISYFSRAESVFSTYLNEPVHISLNFLIVDMLVVFILTVPLVAFLTAPTFQLQELIYRVEKFEKWNQGTLKEITALKKEMKTIN